MRIVRFPQPHRAPGEPPLAEIEAALHGDRPGPGAEFWRALRADVRALAPPLAPELERRLRERIERDATRRAARVRPSLDPRRALARLRAWLGARTRNRAIALAGAGLLAALALVLAAPWSTGRSPIPTISHRIRGGVLSISGTASSARAADAEAAAPHGASSPSRVQQLGASITLAPRPQDVQSVADRVAQLAAQDGGFVAGSQVYVQPHGQSNATLRLQLPSAQLSAALASLAQLAPVRDESQSLQDITGEYDAARTKLADAVAERQALLRALAGASTQGQIESLRQRLSLAAGAVVRARSAYEALARRGATSSVEVTVSGDPHAGPQRSTLAAALHDAGRVLEVALVVLLAGLAVLVPLALLALAWRAARRRMRERALS